MAGTVISAALITGINSDLPGQVLASVTEPVYDSATGRYLLIPQGSRLIGEYDSQVAARTAARAARVDAHHLSGRVVDQPRSPARRRCRRQRGSRRWRRPPLEPAARAAQRYRR